MRFASWFVTVLLLCWSIPLPAQDDNLFDFALSEAYLQKVVQEGILSTFTVHVDARTKKVHTLASDCEIHMAATPADTLATPPGLVVEPPNLCKFRPEGTTATSEKNLREVVWPNLFDDRVIGKNCQVTGFPRIFTEHAQGAGDAANPNHVLEIHPATAISCGGSDLAFTGFLKAIKGMHAIKPGTAASRASQPGRSRYDSRAGSINSGRTEDSAATSPSWRLGTSMPPG
jgi:hypothetical protein